MTTAIPPSKPKPIFICVIPFNTISPNPPAAIIAAMTTMESDIRIVWFIPVMMVGNASGNCTLNNNCIGVAPKEREASITFFGTCLIPRLVRRTTGGMARIMVAKAPGAFATIILAMPPVVRLTSLGIKQVPKNVVEASRSFGATPMQLLFKVQLPLALPTIMTGINQTILMSLSMVVIAAMIAAGGLGEIVLKGITQMKIGLGFEGGIAVVILAIILDRITQGLGKQKKGK